MLDISPGLIAKGLAGLTTATAATTAGTYYKDDIYSFFFPTYTEEQKLLEKVGLECGSDDFCVVKPEGTINIIEDGDKKKTDVSQFSSESGKLKLHRNAGDDYEGGLRFNVEGGNITLTGGTGGDFTELKLNSNYEIKKEGDGDGERWYLSRKISDDERNAKLRGEKIKSLGLPDNCNFPVNGGSVECSNLGAEQLKKINFVGKNSSDLTVTATGNDVKLKIEKVEENNGYVENLKFTFENDAENDVSITQGSGAVSISLKRGMNLEFKIKEEDNKWFLERVWTVDELAKKIKLSCPTTGNGDCSFDTSNQPTINVSEGSKKAAVSVAAGSGKIKFEKDQKGYNQGIKFTIKDADISFTDASASISKLEEFATYEIKEETESGQKKWYLSRKTSAIDEKTKLLGLPVGCELPEAGDKICSNLDVTKLKSINFDGKKSNEAPTISGGGEVNLTISKSGDVEGGYKFVFDNSKEISIPGTSGSIFIKKNTNTEFKIKKSANGGLSLRKIWKIETIKKKIGLDCDSNTKECSIDKGDNKSINVMDGNNKKRKEIKTLNSSGGKIKLYEDVEDYNQGFKFKVEGGSITLADGTKAGNGEDIAVLDDNSEYEMKHEGNKWYLSKK